MNGERQQSCGVKSERERGPLHHVRLSVTRGLQPARVLWPWNPPGKNTGVDCRALLQGAFPSRGLNLGLRPCRRTLYRLRGQFHGQDANPQATKATGDTAGLQLGQALCGASRRRPGHRRGQRGGRNREPGVDTCPVGPVRSGWLTRTCCAARGTLLSAV